MFYRMRLNIVQDVEVDDEDMEGVAPEQAESMAQTIAFDRFWDILGEIIHHYADHTGEPLGEIVAKAATEDELCAGGKWC